MFKDSYYMTWTLKDEQGKLHVEEHVNISLSDFEVIYGNNVHHIEKIELRLIPNVKATEEMGA